MNKDKILSAMDHIDPALVEEADRTAPARRRTGWSGPGLIAACLCLVLAGTAAAASISKVRVAEWFDNQTFPDYGESEYSGFKNVGGIACITGDRFSEEVNQIALSNPRKSVQRSFGSWSAMEELIGLELMDNPVLSAARPAALPPYCIWVSTGEDEISWERPTYPAGTEYTQEDYVTPTGLETAIFRITPQERTAYRWVVMKGYDFVPVEPTTYSAYFSLNGVRFNLTAAHDTDAALALETLKEVLDAFVTEPQAQ